VTNDDDDDARIEGAQEGRALGKEKEKAPSRRRRTDGENVSKERESVYCESRREVNALQRFLLTLKLLS